MKYIYIMIMFFIVLSCTTSQKLVEEGKCPKSYRNNFTKILNEKYITINEGDTTSFNEIRFECVHSALYAHKAMYDKFGKWNKEIYPSNKNRPFLLWERIDLFSNGKKYTVYTNGLEECKHSYTSVMVFDENKNDLLSDSSEEKEKLTNFFANLIKNHNTEKKDFYEIYWKTVDPDRWEIFKEYQKKLTFANNVYN